MRSKDTKARCYNNMVQNPIYTGLSSPVYDSIWPLPETLGEPSSADRRIRATSNTDTKALQGMSADCAPNKMRQTESLLDSKYTF